MNKTTKTLIIGGIALVIMLVAAAITVKIETIGGNQIGVLETWSDGVVEEPLTPKTYIWVPGFNKTVTKYQMNQQVYVMNDKDDGSEFGEGRRSDSYTVPSSEGQPMTLSLSTVWRRDPTKVIALHKNAGQEVEERVIRPIVQRVVKDAATTRSALDAYSGAGLVELQNEIEKALSDPNGDLAQKGIIVDRFVIEDNRLDKAYVEEIRAKQVAVQARLKAIEQTKASEALADKAKADAQADYEKQIVEARRDKERGILDAERKAQQEILAAEAEAKKVEFAAAAERNKRILEAEGEKEAGMLRAQSILALGEAEAEATRLKLSAYNTEGADAFVKIEVSKSMANAYGGIKGFLPESMSVNLLSSQFSEGVNLLVGAQGE